MTIILGLTGSIGMGKTTVAGQFADAGARVSDADAIVHDLFMRDEGLKAEISEAFPTAMRGEKIDRAALGREVFTDEAKLKQLEALMHPRVRAVNLALIEKAKAEGWPLLVLEIPLLYETGAEAICDRVAVVTARPEIQRQRVFARPNMSEKRLLGILARQMPDEEKRARADFIIDTSDGLESSAAQVAEVMSRL